MRRKRAREPESGDARIARAFRRSLVVVAVLAVLAAVVLWWRPGPAPEDRPASSAAPAGPVRDTTAPVAPPPVTFTDVTAAWGIDFVHVNGAYGERLLPETMGSGVAVFDRDGDGDLDLLFVNSAPWPGREAPGAAPTPRLYDNRGDGRFRDVTAGSGLDLSLYGMGVAVGDYDGDGRPDVYLTAVGENRLLRNTPAGFVDVTAAAGAAGGPRDWSTGAAFLDYDRDGDLDLFVANYVEWSRDIDLEVDFRLTGIGRAYGPPTAFPGTHNVLLRNDGDGTFSDVSAAAGIQVANPATGEPMGKALGVLPVDADGDGWLDLFVANDTVQNFLLRNRGDGGFEEVGTLFGVAFDRNGAATGAMGVDAAAFRNDADVGIAVGNFANEMTSLYVTQGGGPPLADEAIVEGIGPASRLALTFGLFFFDYDLDGRQDLLQVNGHLEEAINQVQPSQHYAQPPQLFWNCGTACRAGFVPVADPGDLAASLVGRGAAWGDLDGDGDPDLVVTQNGREARVYRNDQSTGHHWLAVRLEGGAGNPRGVGARIALTTEGGTQTRRVMPARSYLSQVPAMALFGLGASERVERMLVTWPDGRVQRVPEPPVDGTIRVRWRGERHAE